MKNMSRQLHCGLSILALIVASSGNLFAQALVGQTATPLIEQTPGGPSALNAEPQSADKPRIRIGPGDLLDVRVFDTPELTQTIRVNDLGDAALTLIGSLHLGDLTPEEARDGIAHRLVDGHFLVHPQVSVLIQEYGTQGVSVLGEVQKPGVYSILGNRTLLDVISQAGGTTMYAGSTATVKRNSDSKLLTIPLSKNAKDTLASDVRLQPGDKVIIPRASLIYVLGDVSRPGGFLMQDNGHMTILQAMALAGGQTRTAAIDQVRLIHKTDSGYTDTNIRLKKIINGRELDPEIQADDILYIPNSSAKSLIYRTAPGIVQSASTAAIYGAVF